ncbi:MAG: hypothetical protein AB7P49_00140 [Bdellovibrionales bacterium]
MENIKRALEYELCWFRPQISLSNIKEIHSDGQGFSRKNTLLILLDGQSIHVPEKNMIHWLFLLYKGELELNEDCNGLIKGILDNPSKQLLYNIQ